MLRVLSAVLAISLLGATSAPADQVPPVPGYVALLGGFGVAGGMVSCAAGFIALADILRDPWPNPRVAVGVGLVGLGALVSGLASLAVEPWIRQLTSR